MRSLYAERRGYLVDALTQVFGADLSIAMQAGGTHVLAMLSGQRSDRDFAAAAQAHGLAVQALSHWRIRKSAKGGVLMGFANITGPDNAMALARRLLETTKIT